MSRVAQSVTQVKANLAAAYPGLALRRRLLREALRRHPTPLQRESELRGDANLPETDGDETSGVDDVTLASIAWLLPVTRPFLQFAPPGHFYSPIPTLDDVEAHLSRTRPASPTLVDLRPDGQLDLLRELADHIRRFDPPPTANPTWRYTLANSNFGFSDAAVLHAMLRHVRPHHVIEVGSGWSSALMLDTADQLDGVPPRFTFIEPFTEVLEVRLRPADYERVTILSRRVQDVDPAVLDVLGPGDILFIDCSHVSKVGSDVNHLCLEVIPRLHPGVFVHVHDIFFPFEMPEVWLREGRAWNETYLLRALLTGWRGLRIRLWGNYLATQHAAATEAILLDERPFDGGGSLWLERTAD